MKKVLLTLALLALVSVSLGRAAGAAEGKKGLVVYFSQSGNTQTVAQEIQKQTGADIFRIEPVQPYPNEYGAATELAKKEKNAAARPAIANEIKNLGEYGVIYLGYPIWWGDMPMIVYSFLDQYDLSGKVIAPFCTHSGSGICDTVGKIRALEPNAQVLDGLEIYGSQAQEAAAKVADWLNKK